MKILFLDDSKERHDRFRMNHIGQDITPAWNYADACAALVADVFDVAYLDHDLEDPQGKTGEDVAKFIAALPIDRRPRRVVIHSFNAYGRYRMGAVLQDASIPVRVEQFHEGL